MNVQVKVWGDYACFTRPEHKAERVSYDVMTPSAARGVLEGILWKPEMRYRITAIAVLKPIRHASILRNEVNTTQSARTAQGWLTDGRGGFDASADRAQRHALVLRDVAYVISAEIALTALAGDANPPVKYAEMFNRRVAKGQAYRMPYLGTREFSASFEAPSSIDNPIPESYALGRMLLDLRFQEDASRRLKFIAHDGDGASRIASGSATPVFFEARLEQGVMRVPPEAYARLEAR